MSGYTGESMMAAAEKHYRTAEKLLGAMDSTWGNVITDRLIHATAHTQAGLLAVELAKYANLKSYVDIPSTSTDWTDWADDK